MTGLDPTDYDTIDRLWHLFAFLYIATGGLLAAGLIVWLALAAH